METKMKMDERSSTRNRVKEKVRKADNWNWFYLGGIVLLFVGVYLGRKYLGS